MELFRHATSIYGGGDVLIGASYDLLGWFVAAGAAVIVIHAIYKIFTGPDKRAAR